MDCWKCSVWCSIVASQLLYIRLHECCKQLKRPVAVIPQCSYPETRSLETAGMSSFSLSLSFWFKLSFCWFHSLFVCLSHFFFLSVLGMCKQSPVALFSCRPLSPMHTRAEGESRPRHYAHRHDNLSLTQRPMQTMGAMHVAKWESREG